MKVVNVGESLILDVLIDAVLDTAIYHLYKNDVAITADTVIEDLTEADFSGYDSADGDLAATGNVWGAPAFEGDGRWGSTGDTDCEFVRAAGATSNTIYGWYLTDALGELIAVEALAEPFEMAAVGATIRITPYFSVQSREEVA